MHHIKLTAFMGEWSCALCAEAALAVIFLCGMQRTCLYQSLYCNTELRKMIDKKVKVHAFYVADVAKSAFQDIAKRSGGECEYLDLNSNPAGAANILTNMVTVKILSDLGGDECGAQMVAEYKKTFGYVK